MVALADPKRFGFHPAAIELPGWRTQHSKHFKNPDGSMSSYIQHYLHHAQVPDEDGISYWEETDLNFRPDGADYLLDKHFANIRISGASVGVWHRDSGEGVEWLLPGAPKAHGRKAAFADQGIDWQYTTTYGGLKLEAVIASTQGPRTYVFRYRIKGKGHDLTTDAYGNLRGNGFAVPRPTALDAKGELHICGPWRVLNGGRISFDWDDTGVPTPYTLDPSTTVVSAAQDTYIDQQYPNTNYVGATSLGIQDGDDPAYLLRRALLQFDLSSIKKVGSVSAATMTLMMSSFTTGKRLNGDSFGVGIFCSTATTAWNAATITYGNASYGSGSPTASIGDPRGSTAWNVLAMAQHWLVDGAPNYGLTFASGSNTEVGSYYHCGGTIASMESVYPPSLSVTWVQKKGYQMMI